MPDAMLSQRAITIANRYWAVHLGCSPDELLVESFRIVTHGAELAAYRGVFALFRGGSVMASIPPDRDDLRRTLFSGLDHVCSPGGFANALSAVSSVVIGPAFIGYAESVAQPSHPVRALEAEDAAAFEALHESCGPLEWEHGGGSSGDPASGAFVNGRLVAMASYQVWGGALAHISIVTDPEFRNRGFGRSTVAHLAERAITAGLLPQYRTLESNGASLRIAESLGFRRYAVSMAVRLGGVGD